MYSFLLENILRYVTNQQIKNPIPKQNTQIKIYNQKQNEQLSKSSANLSPKGICAIFRYEIQAAIN